MAGIIQSFIEGWSRNDAHAMPNNAEGHEADRNVSAIDTMGDKLEKIKSEQMHKDMKITGSSLEEKHLDKTLKDSFPASDPPAH